MNYKRCPSCLNCRLEQSQLFRAKTAIVGRHDLWTNRDAMMHFWELIALQLGRALLWSAAGSPLPYRFSCLDRRCGVRRSVQGCNGRRKDTRNQPGENVEDRLLTVCRYNTATGCKDDADRHTHSSGLAIRGVFFRLERAWKRSPLTPFILDKWPRKYSALGITARVKLCSAVWSDLLRAMF